MRKRIVVFLIAAVSVLLIISLLVFFDPFGKIFDGIFKQADNEPMGSVGYEVMWQKGEISPSGVPKELVRITEKYFECFYSALGDKKADSRSELVGLYADSSDDCIYDLAALSSCSKRLKGSGIDLSVSSTVVHLWTENLVPIASSGYILAVRQSAELVFKSLKGISSGEGIFLHTFVFEKKSGIWYITSHECQGGVWDYSRKTLNSICGTSSPSYDKLGDSLDVFNAAIESKIENIGKLISYKGYGSFPAAETEYNREGAVEYAFKWCSVITRRRNTQQWKDYDNDSGNFASQCIYAGLNKMDTEGSRIWKWFGDRVNYDIPDKGCSMSWSEPENFWLYCTIHESSGMVAYTDVSGGQLEKGDIVQLMSGSTAFGSVVITDVVTDVGGNKLDFLVTGHDSDIVNFPLSLVHCDGIRMIKIIGFN